MTRERKKDLLITATMFVAMAVAVTVGFIVPRAAGRDADTAQYEQSMFDAVDAAMAADAPAAEPPAAEPPVIDRTAEGVAAPLMVAAETGAPESGEVRGAPLSEAGVSEPGTTEPGTTESGEVRGAPLGESGAAPENPDGVDTSGMTPLRTIPQESWDLLEKLDNKTDNPEELYNFTKTKDGKYLKVTFGALGSYEYKIPDPDELREAESPETVIGDQIPEPLKKIDGEEVVIVGFMVPIEVTREGLVKSFALTQNQAFCCFGVPPGMNEWIMVKMDEGKTADFTLDLPVAAFGKIDVGEEIEDGYIMSVYRMSAGEVIDAQELIRRTQQG